MHMRLHKKISIITAIILIFNICLSPFSYSNNLTDEIIYEKRSSEIITSGVTHENIKRFLSSGWLNINVITVDLSNPYVKLDLLTSSEGLHALADVKTMVEANGAVAGINGDFFSMTEQELKYPLGFTMKSGNIVSTAFYENATTNKLATFSLDKFKQPFYSYVTNNITLIAPNGNQTKIADINKVSSNYTTPVIFNRFWGKYSIGSSKKFPDMVEMVVENGIVKEIRTGMPPVEIPNDGFVVCARQKSGKFLIENFHQGDSVQLDIKINPDLSNHDLAISGGTILIKNGQISPFTHNIKGLHPRSALGTSADNRYLYMVTVDGRQSLSRGLTLEELAKLMLEIGAYNAINLDGGGSTTMVKRPLGDFNIHIANSPSENPLRKVINSLGVFSTASQGLLKGLIIETKDPNIFVNTKREFKVKGYDEFYNPVNINPEEVTWKIEGINGFFTKNILTPLEAGKGIVTATIGNISASLPITVLDSPIEINIFPRYIKTSVGNQVTFSIKGKNKEGYYAEIDPSSLQWTLTNNIGTFSNGIFTATNPGKAIISCSLDKVTAFSGISVSGDEKPIVIEPCEKSNADFKSYPSEVTGQVYLTTEQKHSGLSSYKLSYDFTTTDKTRAAYLVFSNDLIKLDQDITSIGIWVYNPSPKSEWLKAQIIDANGSVHLIDITRDLSWTGWKFLKVPLEENLLRPAKLSRIYVVQIEPSIKSSGEIYIDDITLFLRESIELQASEIPANIVLPDSAQKNVPFRSNSNSFQFVVMGKIPPSKTLLDQIIIQKLGHQIENCVELSALVGEINNEFYKSIKKPLIITSQKNSSYIYKNSTFITLDDSKNSIRLTNPAQWKWFINELDKVKTDNVFILLPKPIDDFSDPHEANLFHEILTDYRIKTQRNVWVISSGTSNLGKIEKGVRFITAAGIEKSTNNDIVKTLDEIKYILITVKGKEITYQIKNLF